MDKRIDENIIRKERNRKLLLWSIGSVAVVAAFCWLLSSLTPSVKSRDLIVATTEEGPLEITVAATGRIVPAHEEIINSPVETRVLRVFAQPGDSVRAGMQLLQLDLEKQESELANLQDSRTARRHELIQLQLSNHTTLSDLEMQIQVSKMNVNRMAIEVENERRLDSIGSGTGERVRQAETAYEAGRLELQQLRTRLNNERRRCAAAEEGRRLEVNAADRDIALMNKTIHQGTIPAPLDGVLTFIVTDIGSRISAGERVAVVSDLSSFKVLGEVAEGSSDKVEIGAEVSVRTNGTQLKGTVTNITPQARQGIVSFVVSLDNPRNDHLRSGGRAELYIASGYKSNVVRLTNGIYYRGAGLCEVFVFDGDNRIVRRTIRVGDCNRDYVEIVSGLQPGDCVVISDMENYINKEKIKISN